MKDAEQSLDRKSVEFSGRGRRSVSFCELHWSNFLIKKDENKGCRSENKLGAVWGAVPLGGHAHLAAPVKGASSRDECEHASATQP